MGKSFSDDFINQNKQALLQEIGKNLNSISDIVFSIVGQPADENAQIDSTLARNALIGIAHHLGFITAVFNQYWIFETGKIPEEKHPMGFSTMTEKKEK